MNFNSTEFRVALVREGKNLADAAEAINVDKSTMSRRVSNGDFRRNEISKLIDYLNLTDEDVMSIFFAN